jgi:uncharacterized membrane protein YfcA
LEVPGLDIYTVAVGATGVIAGVIAAVSGFGIGSLLTPILALQLDTRLAIAAVSVPHLLGTAYRFWTMRRSVDRMVLLEFGIPSAVGGLAGALMHGTLNSRSLTIVFGFLLLFTAAAELTGWIRRLRWGRSFGWIAGGVSGFLGGLVGNQGSVRTIGLLAYDESPTAFVATATTVALIVDFARMPVYLANQAGEIAALWPILVVASGGVVAGTAMGVRILPHLRKQTFRRTVAVLLAALGGAMLISAFRATST